MIRGFTPKDYSTHINLTEEQFAAKKKHIFVYSEGGKPVFTRYDNETTVPLLVATLCAVTSVINSKEDKIQCIQSNDSVIVMYEKKPLYCCCICKTDEHPEQIKAQVKCLLHFIYGIVPQQNVINFYQKSPHFDLGKHLQGDYAAIKSFVHTSNYHLGNIFKALIPFQMNDKDRRDMGNFLLSLFTSKRESDTQVLLSCLFYREQLVLIVENALITFSEQDINLLWFTIKTKFDGNARENRTGIPYQTGFVCLNDFNSTGHVYYIFEQLCHDVFHVVVAIQENFVECFGFTEAFKAKFVDEDWMRFFRGDRRLYCDELLRKEELLDFIYISRKDKAQLLHPEFSDVTMKEAKKFVKMMYVVMVEMIENQYEKAIVKDDGNMYVTCTKEACLCAVVNPCWDKIDTLKKMEDFARKIEMRGNKFFVDLSLKFEGR